MTIDPVRMDEARPREVWSVHAFAQHHSLDRMDESRLKMLLGAYAQMRDLLATQRHISSGW
ncbi:hypothetical protein [Rhizobium sp. BK379]|uniref:hypothetical protein n=1 Tax=Rhizobium sp. BK379 TaxID=2587059 RepID=UPI000DD71089|nr:hypothetical protein [Rhizobium sp. BK379]MBB3442478.1 hypothetical protein [Rhizobium sp. BK379]